MSTTSFSALKYTFLLVLSLLLCKAQAHNPASAGPVTHLGLDSLLRKHVSTTGKVDYKGLKAQKKALDAYCKYLGEHVPDDSWTRQEQMAYWINAYNAFTLQLIVSHYPLTSINKLDKGKTWDVKRITLGGKKYSLNMIENDILRPTYKDARIHFAINCAAKSCPPLHNRAYTAENLETTLEARTKAFVNNEQFNALRNNKAQISKIFEWYAADFGDVKTFLNKYSVSQIGRNATIEYQEYNWDLNQ
jgi:hypothetical protein